jgi:hypothetical protein
MKRASLPLRRREFISLLGGTAVAWPLAAVAQQPTKVPIIGFLGAESASTNRHFFDAFQQGMREFYRFTWTEETLLSWSGGPKVEASDFLNSLASCSA